MKIVFLIIAFDNNTAMAMTILFIDIGHFQFILLETEFVGL